MPETAAEIAARIEALTQPGYRGNLIARGLARGLIWRKGTLPPEAPNFSPDLTHDLLDHGFTLLASSLRLREVEGDHTVIGRGLYAAAEAIESAARHADPADTDRGFHLTMAAGAFHIGGYAARAYSLFSGDLAVLNLASYERALVQLMRRDLIGMRQTFGSWLRDEANSDAGVMARLQRDERFDVDDVIATALTRLFHRAIATFEAGLLTGNEQYFRAALTRFLRGEEAAGDANHVPLWWAFKVARHLCDELWGNSLRNVVPKDGGPPSWPELRDRFVQMLAGKDLAEIDLWPSQIEAARRSLDTSDDLVVALPTSAGKTRIAELCILRTLADDRRVIYVTPLRALSAQIELGLARVFRPLGFSVTSVYGASGVAVSDLKTLRSARIVVATPEKLDFAIRQDPTVLEDVGLIVLDEGHMIGLNQREIRYETLVQRLLRRDDADTRRLVCLSAVFAEGDAFDDFTAWLRSDAPGRAIRSVWRPTRQRPGRLFWTGTSGRLEFDVEDEHPFVQRFIEPQPGTGRRRKAFPKNDQEFIVAAAHAFLRRGQTVLVYCPKKASVEATASAFLSAHEQGYFPSFISSGQRALLNDAFRIGEEWLGRNHPAVASLSLGVAVHHGSLPRQFLSEIEHLLRKRILPTCICSPTLAQGLDLCFSVLLFRSLYRHRDEVIPATEFANVIGRVGRAFVDLDGLYVLPVFETSGSTRRKRFASFASLISRVHRRRLNSGVRQLIRLVITILQSRLNCTPDKLAEYVLNLNSPWEVTPSDTDNYRAELEKALNELDAAILGVVDVFDTPTEEIADYLDECLKSSYWQRQLRREGPDERLLQQKVIRGRAAWIWSHSTPERRKAYFSAGIGYKAGSALGDHLEDLGHYLRGAEDAIDAGDLDTASANTVALAEIIYAVGPFVPDEMIEGWQALLGDWLRGTALGNCTNNEGVSFVQENVVYRLVWGVEAARLQLAHISDIEEPAGGTLALCLTYGVPSLTCALLMQAGLRSRTLALRAAEKIGVSFADIDALRRWIRNVRLGRVEAIEWETDTQQAAWNDFLKRFDHRDITRWRDIEATLPIRWLGDRRAKPHSRVRVVRRPGESVGDVLSVSSVVLGETTIPKDIRCDYFSGIVQDDQKSITVSFFGF